MMGVLCGLEEMTKLELGALFRDVFLPHRHFKPRTDQRPCFLPLGSVGSVGVCGLLAPHADCMEVLNFGICVFALFHFYFLVYVVFILSYISHLVFLSSFELF